MGAFDPCCWPAPMPNEEFVGSRLQSAFVAEKVVWGQRFDVEAILVDWQDSDWTTLADAITSSRSPGHHFEFASVGQLLTPLRRRFQQQCLWSTKCLGMLSSTGGGRGMRKRCLEWMVGQFALSLADSLMSWHQLLWCRTASMPSFFFSASAWPRLLRWPRKWGKCQNS